jgi:hypothetical protein
VARPGVLATGQPDVTVATMLMGTSRLYRFADRNPAIQIRATS